MAILQKIVSAIMALIMSLFSFILPPADDYPLPSYCDIISTGSGYRSNVGVPVICRSYRQFKNFCKESNSEELDTYVKLFDKELFDDYCVIAMHFDDILPSESAYVTSAEYDGETLVLDYVYVSAKLDNAICVLIYETIIIVADKRIKNVELNYGGDQRLDFYLGNTNHFVFSIAQADPVAPYYPENEGCFEGYFIFEDYESWADFRDNGNWKFSRYFDIAADESFFERNNLVVAITTLSSGAYRVCFSDVYENGDKAEIELYTVHEQGIHPEMINYNAAMVAVSKDIKTADANYTEFYLPFQLDRVEVNRAYSPNWAYPPD